MWNALQWGFASRLPAASAAGPVRNVFRGLAATKARDLENKNLGSALDAIDGLIARGPFKSEWDSLHQHQEPDWFQDAKFGIYTHWGPVTVGSSYAPGDSQWYGNQMYTPSHPAFAFHKEVFGDQHTMGFKDMIPRFTGEKFNPEEWADVFVRAGAKFAGPVAIHHDNFALWNSSLTRWNSLDMGPRRDVVGELEKAYRAKGLRFITSFHHGFAWRYYEPSFAFDGSDPANADLYTEVHAKKAPPSKHFQDLWLAEVYEVLTKYSPDLIYFDFEFYEVITPEYDQKLFAMAYDWASRNGRQIAVTQKDSKIHQHTGILDFERGRADAITPYPWLTDTAIGPWFYAAAEPLKTATQLIGVLADIVSKNGCMMLDVGPHVDGTLPPKSVAILLQIGDWLKVNGEAIYGTRPWKIYGEGPTKNGGGASFSEQKDKDYTARDVRFTTRGEALYAILLGWPGSRAIIQTVMEETPLPFGKMRRISLLGSTQSLNWRYTREGLEINLPAQQVGEHAFVLKME